MEHGLRAITFMHLFLVACLHAGSSFSLRTIYVLKALLLLSAEAPEERMMPARERGNIGRSVGRFDRPAGSPRKISSEQRTHAKIDAYVPIQTDGAMARFEKKVISTPCYNVL